MSRKRRRTNGNAAEPESGSSRRRIKRYLTLNDRHTLVKDATQAGHEAGYRTGFQVATEELKTRVEYLEQKNETLEIVIAGLHPAATALATLSRGKGD